MKQELSKKASVKGGQNEPLVIQRFYQTCQACPSQWEGWLEDGRMIYVRCRWGGLAVSISNKTTKDVMDAIGKDAEYIFNEQIADEYDGIMDTNELIGHIGHLIKFPETVV